MNKVSVAKSSAKPVKPYVNMSNALTRAGHGLTLGEKRLVALAISGLDSKRPLSTSEYKYTSRISADAYAEAFGIKDNTAYEQMAYSVAKLFSRFITFYEPAFKRNGAPIEPTKRQMRWVGEAEYQSGEGWVELHWWPPLMKHLVGLKGQFTSYNLEQTTALRSVYSWKLLELLMRFKSNGWAEYSIDDFYVAMDATDSMKNDFAKIRTKIIEPAIKELTQKDNWEIEWQAIRKGTRKVTGLKFKFKRSPQQQLNLE